jgi:hypothetical protein
MDSLIAASGSRTNPAQLAASERLARAQEQNAVSVASPGSNPSASSGKLHPIESPSATHPHPTMDAQHVAALAAQAQAQAETQQASQNAGVPQVYGQVDPTRPSQVFSLRV